MGKASQSLGFLITAAAISDEPDLRSVWFGLSADPHWPLQQQQKARKEQTNKHDGLYLLAPAYIVTPQFKVYEEEGNSEAAFMYSNV